MTNVLQNGTGLIMLNVDELYNLPKKLKDGFKKLNTFDSKIDQVYDGIIKNQNEIFQNLIYSKGSPKKQLQINKEIEKLTEQGNSCCDEKFKLINKMYDMVDDRIQELDSSFSKFESELLNETRNDASDKISNSRRKKKQDSITNKLLSQFKEKKNRKIQSIKKPNTNKSLRKKLQQLKPKFSLKKSTNKNNQLKNKKLNYKSVDNKQRTNLRNKQKSDDEDGDDNKSNNLPNAAAFVLSLTKNSNEIIDMPTDPYEPVYCLCHDVSYGDMIGCDNSDCPIEWFHFACVDITETPKGAWYCPRCRPSFQKT